MKTGLRDEFFEGLYQQQRARAAAMAEASDVDSSVKKLTPEEFSTIWNRRAMPLEKEWELFRQRNEDGTPTYTREQIGLMVFPDREKLAKSGGKFEPREFIKNANAIARRESAKREQQQQTIVSPMNVVAYDGKDGVPFPPSP